mgnify:CR=1 FL=1
MESQLGAYDSEALGGLVWALVVLGLQAPPTWMEAVMARARVCLEAEAPAGASRVGGAGSSAVVSLRELLQAPGGDGMGPSGAANAGAGAGAVVGWDGYSRAATQGLLAAIVEGAAVGSDAALGWPQQSQPPQKPQPRQQRPQRRPEQPATDTRPEGGASGQAAQQQGRRQGAEGRRQAYGYLSGPYKRRSAAGAGQHRRRAGAGGGEAGAGDAAAPAAVPS